MKTTASILALAAAVQAHYTFDKIQVNGETIGQPWQYIREHTRGYMPTKGQQILENDFRCQPGGESGAKTDVYTVGTGDKVQFLGAYGMNSIEHPGPAQVYMSATDDVKSYDGSGDWFKVRDALFCSSPQNDGALKNAWCTWGQPGIEFTVPDTIPDGEYLVRVEHIPLHGAQGTSTGAEYYYSCAQLKVEGSTVSAMPAFDTIKIPGGVQPDDPAVEFNIWTQVKEYPYTVGPELIPGGTTWGTADGSSKEVVVKGGSAPAASGSSSTGSSAGASASGSASSGSSSSSSEDTTPIDQPTSSENTTTVEPVDPSSNQGGAAGSSAGKDCDVQYVERSVRRSFTA